MRNDLLSYLARSCAYAQEHIDDLDAWPSGAIERLDYLQCVSYQVACFLCSATEQGKGGVPWDVVSIPLCEHPAKTPQQWEVIISEIANDYGGWLPSATPKAPDIDSVLLLAAVIREVDGNNKLGAAALAEAILSHRAIAPMVSEATPTPADAPRYYIVDIDTSHYMFQHMPDWYGVVDGTKGKFGVGAIIAYFADKQQAEDFKLTLLPFDP